MGAGTKQLMQEMTANDPQRSSKQAELIYAITCTCPWRLAAAPHKHVSLGNDCWPASPVSRLTLPK